MRGLAEYWKIVLVGLLLHLLNKFSFFFFLNYILISLYLWVIVIFMVLFIIIRNFYGFIFYNKTSDESEVSVIIFFSKFKKFDFLNILNNS